MVFSLGHLAIFGGKPENCEIPESFRKNPYYFGRVGILSMIVFLNESLNNKLYEYEATFEQFFSEKKSTSKSRVNSKLISLNYQ